MRLAILTAAVALAGCGTLAQNIPDNHVQMTLNSDPQGASVFVAGQYVGVTPIPLNFGPLTAQDRAAKKMTTLPVRVVWASGAEVTKRLFTTWAADRRTYTTALTLARPPLAGLAVDIAHAAQIQARAQQQQQAAAAQQNARNADAAVGILGFMLGGAAAYQEGRNAGGYQPHYDDPEPYRAPAQAPSYNCTSRASSFPGKVITDCSPR